MGLFSWLNSGPAGEGDGDDSFLNIRSINVRNSSSSKILRSASSSACSRTSEFMSSWIGTSILIVARNFEKMIISRFVSTFVFNAPFNWSVCSRRFSMLPNSAINFWAVFSPTPGHPGILSEESPISPSISITCAGDWISNLAFTCSIPITSNSLSPYLGRYMNTWSVTSWP